MPLLEGSAQGPEEAKAAKPGGLLSRRFRWGVVLALIPFILFLTERASHSDYELPPKVPLYRAQGVLEAPPASARNWSIGITLPDGKRIHLGCEPNASLRIGHDCMPPARQEAIAGTRVTADYFIYPRAFTHQRVVMKMIGPKGEVLISPDQQRVQLEAARQSDREKTWLFQLPMAVFIAVLTGLIFELMHGFVAVLEWLVRLSRRA